MIRITDRSSCCGCTACASVCPHGAISMKEDRMGFAYPQLDESLCTECGLCVRTCDFIQERAKDPVPDRVKVIAARHVDNEKLAGSQSGGVFTALSDVILADGGVVYGASLTDDYSVSHIRVDNIHSRECLKGSKYVQSNLTGIFAFVRNDLQKGIPVMFTGTPCQVAGLRSFIVPHLQENLFTVDFICHGVPSPAVWNDYVTWMSGRAKPSGVSFRDGDMGWRVHWESFSYAGRKEFRETWRLLFYKNIMLRRSCFRCPYNINERKADVTMADFWGVEEIVPELADGKGVSMVICFTEKGSKLFSRASSYLRTAKAVVSKEFLLRKNPNLVRPSVPDKDLECFETAYQEKGFVHVAQRWADLGWRYKAWKIKKYIANIFRKK
ncbi:MAG: 4Fe-4S dicluster domain-containing protein [Bacteroidales bacterium]|nr:4Fe-4S dicluster domain-containing protein [Bacteroidales bacterium]